MAKWSLNTRIDSNSNYCYGNIFIELAILGIQIHLVILTYDVVFKEFLFINAANNTINHLKKPFVL